ncbi:MAG: hypothetical protein JWO40_706 [Candidatus Doudnabacteria bacterium]|nr:hypothetical protein [Candidatus Doudnabacteria bacterium]
MLKKAVMILGVVFVLVGILGFFSMPILGIFGTNLVHNLVHLISGLLLIFAASKSEDAAQMAAKTFGVIYALVTILGFVTPSLMTSLINVNMADNILHIVLTLVLLYLGFGTSKMSSPSQPSM